MNRTSRIAVALWAGLAAIGCTDLLTEDPQGFTTTDTFYKTGADLNSGTIAIYNSLRRLQGQGPWTTLELASPCCARLRSRPIRGPGARRSSRCIRQSLRT